MNAGKAMLIHRTQQVGIGYYSPMV